MIATPTKNIHKRLKDVLEIYLGPAAERFLERQISYHLQKSPSQLTPEDIPELTEWIKISIALLTNDKSTIDECEQKLLAIID